MTSKIQTKVSGVAEKASLADLSDRPIWVAWRADRDGKKVPYNPDTHEWAKSDDPTTWGIRAAADAAAKALLKPSGFGDKPVGGIGIQFADLGDGTAIGGIDLDSCREDGKFTPWANEVIKLFGSYTEVSPSGTGGKIFFRYRTADLAALKKAAGT